MLYLYSLTSSLFLKMPSNCYQEQNTTNIHPSKYGVKSLELVLLLGFRLSAVVWGCTTVLGVFTYSTQHTPVL